jgi:hypothetical protein
MRYLVCLAAIAIASLLFVMVHRDGDGVETHPADSEVQPEEYAIYSALVRQGQTVLNETSITFLSDLDGGGERLLQQAPNLEKSTIADYIRKNAKTYPLSDRFTTRVTLVGTGEYGTGRENAVNFFSRVGFDADRSQALVHVGSHCSPACADDYYSVLTRAGKEWKVAESLHLRTWN